MRGVYSAIAALILAVSLGLGAGARAEDAAAKPLPPPTSYGPFKLHVKMIPRVKFWVEIYSRTFSWEFLIHDVKYPWLVYSKIDTKNKPRGYMNAEKARVVKVLQGLVAKVKLMQAGKLTRDKLKPEEEKFYAMFEAADLLPALPQAADLKRVRGQAGLRDNLEDAIFVSGRYLPRMEKVMERFDLPTEIAYLPFVESGFNKKAVSKVGASGIWQFMPYTGKLYLRVDEEVDERNDPMRAAEAAARLMKQNKDLLGEWPLAITAYNHGAAGVARSAKEVGSKELPDIIEKSEENKNFGFASQNFFASFMAAIHVAKNSEAFLGNVPRAKKLEFDEFVMPHYMDVRVFLEKLGLEETAFRELNPALTPDVFNGKKLMPVGYTVRIPTEIREDFFKKYEAIPGYFKLGEQKASLMAAPAGAPVNVEATPEAAGLILPSAPVAPAANPLAAPASP